MRITILFSLLIFLAPATLPAQSNKFERKLQKAQEQAENNKLDEADKTLVDLLKDDPGYGEAWDLLAKVRLVQYRNSQLTDNIFTDITVTTKNADGKEEPGSDSLAQSLKEMMKNFKPSKMAYDKYLYTMRKALLFSEDAFECSMKLRTLLVDTPVDTAVSKKALRYYNEAEEEFGKNNFEEAARLYKRAIDEQPDFYKARLYLGDAYYFTGNYHAARASFSEAIATYPQLIEPRKFLVDAYAKDRMYNEALAEAIKGMAVYPDASMMRKLEDAVYLCKKKMDIHRTPRAVFPNRITPAGETEHMLYTDPDMPEAKGEWLHYVAARDKISSFCNDQGIVEKSTPLTRSRYMEVYAWEEMLANSTAPGLEEARRMQKEGYLDCYVLVTCYHIDFYDQYHDFVTKNTSRVIAYYNQFIRPSE